MTSITIQCLSSHPLRVEVQPGIYYRRSLTEFCCPDGKNDAKKVIWIL